MLLPPLTMGTTRTMADQVVFERFITDYEGIEGLVDKVREQVIAWFDSNGRNDTLFKLVVDTNPSRGG